MGETALYSSKLIRIIPCTQMSFDVLNHLPKEKRVEMVLRMKKGERR
jgi:hypothetical protein